MSIFQNMQLFVAVAQASSFRQAAEALGLPNSSVSRRIAALENELGLRLFNRTTRRVELTDAGNLYFQNCKRIVKEAELAHLELSHLQTQPQGVIRASVPVDFSVIYLSPLMGEFSKLYPGIRFELDLTPNQADLMADRVDFAIRMGIPKDQQLIARPIAKLETMLVASPTYLSQQGVPLTPQDLTRHACLRMNDKPWVLTHDSGQTQSVNVDGPFLANNRGFLYQLAIEGHGIAQSASTWVAKDLHAETLVQVLPDWTSPTAVAYAVTTTRLLPAKVRVFLDFLSSRLDLEASLLSPLD